MGPGSNSTVVVFADTVNGGDDIDALHAFLAAYGWADTSWFSVGFDVTPGEVACVRACVCVCVCVSVCVWM